MSYLTKEEFFSAYQRSQKAVQGTHDALRCLEELAQSDAGCGLNFSSDGRDGLKYLLGVLCNHLFNEGIEPMPFEREVKALLKLSPETRGNAND